VTIIVTDWRWHRIPNLVTYPTMLAGLALGAAESIGIGNLGAPFFGGGLDHVVGLALGFLISYPLYQAGGLKGGDGKFLMAVGALKGTTFFFVAAVWGALIGGVIAIGFIVARRIEARRTRSGESMRAVLRTWIPYGVALGLGALVALALELTRIS
jgi:prepilin peptidase CpaA